MRITVPGPERSGGSSSTVCIEDAFEHVDDLIGALVELRMCNAARLDLAMLYLEVGTVLGRHVLAIHGA